MLTLAVALPQPPAFADTSTPVEAAPAAPALPPATLHERAGEAVSGAASAVAGLAWGLVGKVRSMAAATAEALYETAYMLGTNRTPVPRSTVADPVSDLPAGPNAMAVLAPPPTKAAVATAPAAPKPLLDQPAQPIELAAATIDTGRPAATPPSPAGPAPAATSVPDPGANQVEAGLLANFVYDEAERRADGSFFVPKPLQRLFRIRTETAVMSAMPLTVKLPGHIVPDPHAHGQVEASLLGRIVAPPDGLPVVGEAVKAGQVLGYVEPAVGVVDRTEVRRKVAELTTEIRVETESLEILKQFFFVPFRDGKIYQAEQRLAGLRRERDALLPLLQTQEPLRAPTDGVISESAAIPGSIVHPGDRIFEIVNPKLLWVEASAPDPATADAASRVVSASALTPEGTRLTLTFVGSSLAVRQQSTPVLFRIEDPPPGLRVGRPVTVSVESENRAERGIPVPREAITIAADGVQLAWEQTAPEVFVPHPVRTRDLDGQTMLVVDGLSEGAHIAVHGASLLAQLQ
jgi:biotin carboxyl carrier protein